MAPLKLTKAEIVDNIVDNISERTTVQRAVVHVIIDEFFQEIKGALSDDRIVELRGFGTFEIRTRKGRARARNPKTGEIVPVNTHGVAAFRPGKDLKTIAWPLRK